VLHNVQMEGCFAWHAIEVKPHIASIGSDGANQVRKRIEIGDIREINISEINAKDSSRVEYM
jgi:hypothetical protein